MKVEEAIDLLPGGPMYATVTLPDGSRPARRVPVSPPYAFPVDLRIRRDPEIGARAVIGIDWENGTDYSLRWPIDAVKKDGDLTHVYSPRGCLTLRSR